MAHIVTVNIIGKPRPNLGGRGKTFHWNVALGRYVWDAKILQTVGEVAQAVNEAYAFLRSYDEPLLHMSVMEVAAKEIPTGPRHDFFAPEKARKLQVLTKS